MKTAGMVAAGQCGWLHSGIHAQIPHSFIAQYREDHPRVEVEITEGTARDTVMQLRADQLDVVFVAGTAETVPLGEDVEAYFAREVLPHAPAVH